MQVPNVTLEDLQAFQYKHFPGHTQPPLQENDLVTEEDLGYYPDGVKRTLTDEQIKMFRHSEIHALVRKKQLQEDEADYEARMRLATQDVSDVNKDTTEEQQPVDTVTGFKREEQSKQYQRGGEKNSDARTQASEPLDYGDESSRPLPSAERPKSPVSRAPYLGRRIISYDD